MYEGSFWLRIAKQEVQETIQSLPAAIREKVKHLVVNYEPFPSEALQADGVEPDTLGLFLGESLRVPETSAVPWPPQIILFLENLLDLVAEDVTKFRKEVRITYLHELGHYLGLEEDELTQRGLD